MLGSELDIRSRGNAPSRKAESAVPITIQRRPAGTSAGKTRSSQVAPRAAAQAARIPRR